MSEYSTFTDDELFSLLRQRDHNAFTAIYNRYRHILYIHALKLTKDPDNAQDILHDLFTALWDRADVLNTGIPLRAYLFKAVKNRVFDLFSRSKVRADRLRSLQEFIDQGTWITDEAIREKELMDILGKEVALLPDKMRSVFEASRNSELSYKEIATAFSISDKTVKKQISNAIKILRHKMKLLGYGLFFFLIPFFTFIASDLSAFGFSKKSF